MKKIFFSLLAMATSTISANSCNPCDPCEPCPEFTPPPSPKVCAYNAPYGVDLLCQWDVFLNGSFLWLEATEENLSLGTIVTQQTPALSALPIGINRDINQFDCSFKPGFKVGLGINFDCDNWELYAEYTYFHPSTSTSISEFTTNSVTDGLTTSMQIIPEWFAFLSNPYIFNTASGDWNLKMDLADFELARQYYVGRCLTFRTHGGLRAAWIRQSMSASYTGTEQLVNPEQTVVYSQKGKTDSWAVGPKVGLDTKWLFCGGFRFFGNTSGSLLYTQYTTVSESGSLLVSDTATDGQIINALDASSVSSNPCFVRPQAEITLGAGWGDYFYCNKWYFDLEVGYTFNVFWNQNMFLETSTTSAGDLFPTKVKGGDLSLNGLVVTARIDF